MNELELAAKIANHLNHSIKALDQATIARLQAARERALAASRARQLELSHAHAGAGGGSWGQYFSSHPRLAFGALALVAALGLSYSLTRKQDSADPLPIDAQILASDVPLSVIAREDFESWLKNSSR
jgi:Protein of unknown function (DUF3619)